MKRLFYFFIFLLLLTNQSYSENFSEIKILGNKRITKETIILFSGAENLKNKEIKNKKNNKLLKKLYKNK